LRFLDGERVHVEAGFNSPSFGECGNMIDADFALRADGGGFGIRGGEPDGERNGGTPCDLSGECECEDLCQNARLDELKPKGFVFASSART